jgi:hypothetical protein
MTVNVKTRVHDRFADIAIAHDKPAIKLAPNCSADRPQQSAPLS